MKFIVFRTKNNQFAVNANDIEMIVPKKNILVRKYEVSKNSYGFIINPDYILVADIDKILSNIKNEAPGDGVVLKCNRKLVILTEAILGVIDTEEITKKERFFTGYIKMNEILYPVLNPYEIEKEI